MDEHGVGLITVQGGWVGFEHDGREAFIPAGATGRTYPGRGPGTPTYTEASVALRAAIDTIDQVDGAAAQAAPLETVLREARPEDALTLWHLARSRRCVARAAGRGSAVGTGADAAGRHARGHPRRQPRDARRLVERPRPRHGRLVAHLAPEVESRRTAVRHRAAGNRVPGTFDAVNGLPRPSPSFLISVHLVPAGGHMSRIPSAARALGIVALLITSAVPALAGPPLICHPFDIGTAKSLPSAARAMAGGAGRRRCRPMTARSWWTTRLRC